MDVTSDGAAQHGQLEGDVVAGQLARLVRRAEILRQIHSDYLFRVSNADRRWTVALLVGTASVGFLGFTGAERVQQQLAGVWLISVEAVTMLYNVVVLATILTAVVIVAYGMPERVARHHRAVQALSEFILDIEQLLLLAETSPTALAVSDLEVATIRYKGLAAALPPSSDEDFLQSKRRLQDKERESHRLASSRSLGETLVGERNPQRILSTLIAASPMHHTVLDVLRDAEEKFHQQIYVCGGFVRNLVWDSLHNYTVATPLDDIDIIYVGRAGGVGDSPRPRTGDIETFLKSRLPNLPWSVTDLSEVMPKYGSGHYGDLAAALRDFPETASAIAIRRHNKSDIELVAPLGTGDLMSGVVRPVHPAASERVAERTAAKGWLTTWPRLQLVPHPIGAREASNTPSPH